MHAFLADTIVVIHFVYVSFVVFAQLFILVGYVANWECIRNPWFRVTHFLMIFIVAVEAIVGYECPLTTWENQLREAAGQMTNDIGFVGRLVRDLMFFEGPPWIFTTCYIGFATLVLLTLVVAPPRFRKRAATIESQPAPGV
jgi:hypothetical protein